MRHSGAQRILETLCAKGYMRQMARRSGYMLTSKIMGLSAGCHSSPMTVETLRHHADELTREYLWPFSVAALDRDAMVVRYSSIPLSPLAHKSTTLHRRLYLFSRAHGIARSAASVSAPVSRRTIQRRGSSAMRAAGTARSLKRAAAAMPSGRSK